MSPHSASDISNSRQDNVSPSPQMPKGDTTRYNAWWRRHTSDEFVMIVLAMVTGVLCGFAALLFKYLISEISGLFIRTIDNDSFNWWLIPLPIVGIVLSGIFTRYVVRTNLTHGVAQLIGDLKKRMYRLRHNIVISPVLGGSITLGFGGSAGAEGPVAYAGAAIGSNIGQLLGIGGTLLKNLVACGASAGIAAIFSAPVGGMMFGFELLRIPMSPKAILGVTVACVTSFLTVFTFRGFVVDFPITVNGAFQLAMTPEVLLLGLACGLYSSYYSSITSRLDIFFRGIRNPWIRNITGGLMVGVVVAIFPSMFSVGYPVINHVVNGDFSALARGSILTFNSYGVWTLPVVAAGILLCKCWAVSSTNSSGGVAGDFAPTLFAGCMSGYLFSSVANLVFGTSLPVGLFSYLGMAGVMAGAIQAPLMAIFITLEITQKFEYSFPVVICAAVSFCTVKTVGWITGHGVPLILHRHWFSDDRPEPTVNSSK